MVFNVNYILLVSAALGSCALTYLTNWLALIPWRRAKAKHWTERARLFHPVRIAAASNLWVVPTVLSLTVLLLYPRQAPPAALLVLAAIIGAVAGTVPLDREVFPRIPLNELLRLTALGWLMRFAMWGVLVGAIAYMPTEFNAQTALLTTGAFAFLVFWQTDGSLRVAHWLSLFLPVPPRLQDIVGRTARSMNVEVREVLLMRGFLAQAFAFPHRRRLLFTERLLQALSDDEIAAVCAHELGHLTEHWTQYYQRYVTLLIYAPWLLLQPLQRRFGVAALLALCWLPLLGQLVYRRVSHKLEQRADHLAVANEPEAGTYARALALIHEDNLLPAVVAKSQTTHPHLYDRLLAAGLTPDFPRPAAAQFMAWHGILFAACFGRVVALFAISQAIAN